MQNDTTIKVGDFVFCMGEGMCIFPVESVGEKSAFLSPNVLDTEIGSGGNESLHKLTLVDNSEWASHFPQFCRHPVYIRAAGNAICQSCNKAYHDHPQHNIFPFLNIICGGMVVKL